MVKVALRSQAVSPATVSVCTAAEAQTPAPAAPEGPTAATTTPSTFPTPSPTAASKAAGRAQHQQREANSAQALHAMVSSTMATTSAATAASTDAGRVIAGFKQGGTGNCVSVAAIKAAMVAFGPDRIFRDVTRTATGQQVTMRDGTSVHVSDAELREAARHSRLVGTDAELTAHATLAYAAMAKRAMAEGNDGRRHRTFASACNSLNNGESYLEGAHWLGIEGSMKQIPASEIGQHVAVVAASKKHAVFSSQGTIDRFGSAQETSGDGFGRRLQWAYAIIPDEVTTPAPAPTPTPTPAPAPTSPTSPSAGSGGTVPSGGHRPSGAEIISAFKQGGTGNCVSVAAIKAAMTAFGPDRVFSSSTRVAGGTDIVMRDGVRVHVSDEDLRKARGLSRFVGPASPTLDAATMMYAAMCKRAMLEGNDGYRHSSIESAARSLNNGESYLEGAHWLGLDAHMKTISPNDLDRYPAAIAASKKHAVFVADGAIDRFGASRDADDGDGFGRRLRWAYAIVP